MAGRARNIIEILIRSKADKGGFDTAGKELKELSAEGQKASTGLGGLGVSLGSIAAAAGIATTAFVTFKKAMDLGREGAVAIQTAQSFDMLLRKLDATPTLLNDLRKASRGTVDDLTLMSSTATLLAGTSDELGRAMAGAAPELMEIAKAANKLNPTLGDTTFLYQSLATGIKRSSPLILDNLGLTIKLGEANERMAQKLGKTVEALSAEEQKMALLEETLRAGAVMLDQAGGSTESATDSFDRLTAALKNLADEGKKRLVPVMGEIAGAIADMLEALDISDIQAAAEELLKTEKTYKGYTQAVLDAAVANDALSKEHAEIIRKHLTHGASIKELEEMYSALGLSLDDITKDFGLLTQVEWKAMQSAKDLSFEHENLKLGLDDTARSTRILEQAQKDSAGATEEQKAAMEALAKAVDLVRGRYENFYSTLAKGLVNFRDMSTAQRESAEDYEKALAELQAKAAAVYSDVKLDFEESLPDATTVAERLGMAEDAWDEWGLRFQDIINRGVESPWYAMLEQMGLAKPPDVGIQEWAEQLKRGFYEGDLSGLINTQSQAWQEHSAVIQQSQAEATAAYNAEVAKRRAAAQSEIDALKAAREEQLAAEREARQRATLELSLSLAEQTGLLQAWSQQAFGPDFSQVADSAAEVLALLDSGMLEMDASLQNLIQSQALGLQKALDMTGESAETNKAALAEMLDPAALEEKAADLERLLDLRKIIGPEKAAPIMEELGIGIEEGLPEDPFLKLSTSFTGATTAILEGAATMQTELGSAFEGVGETSSGVAAAILSDWVGHSVFPDIVRGGKDMQGAVGRFFAMMQSDGSNSADNISSAWKKGMNEAKDAVDKVHDALKALPKEITITVKTAIVGGAPGYQHGGQFTVEGPPGPDKVPVAFMATRGETVTVTPASMVAPDLRGGGRATGAMPVSIGGDSYRITINDRMAAAMVLAEIEARRGARFGAYMGG